LAENVAIEFHKSNFVSGEPAAATLIDIDAGEWAVVNFTWTNLQYGSQDIWIKVSHSGESQLISKSFDVAGLPNLRFEIFELNPVNNVHEGDLVDVQIQVENSGHAVADASHMELIFAGSSSLISVPSLQIGANYWLNQSGVAPAAGTYDISGVLNADSSDEVVESSTGDNQETRTLNVESLPDYIHSLGPVVVQSSGLAGPWSITGTIARELGSGDSSIPLHLSISDGITLEIINLQFTQSDEFAEYEFVVQTADLTNQNPGGTVLEVEIDPMESVLQSNSFNDMQQVLVTIHQEPNVVVTPAAVARPSSVTPGESVTFDVSLQNVGMVSVTGVISATFDGVELQSQSIIIPASNTGTQGQRTVSFTATVGGGESRDVPFTASWQKETTSHDRIAEDNTATGYVHLNSDLQLRLLQTTEGWSPGLPLHPGYEYVYSIDVVASQSSGSETFECRDNNRGVTFDVETLQFEEGETKSLSCEIDIEENLRGSIELTIISYGGSTSSYSKIWNIESSDDQSSTESENRSTTVILLILGGALAIISLIAAVILTRRGLANTERETWALCPACEGEIEGDEDTCPYCDFNLDIARSKFHDCESCNATIPSMMEHCPYCGEGQDLSSHYDRRERKFISLPDSQADSEVEPDDDEESDEVVRGSQIFEEQAAEMGFAEDQWEGEWDSKLDEAESYFDDKEEARIAAEEMGAESEEVDDVVGETELSQAMEEMPEHDLDAFLGDVEKRQHLSDEDVELSASDAHYREKLFEMTGEDGVLPGQSVDVEAIVDNTVVGNELRSASSDFTVTDGEPSPSVESETDEGSEAVKDTSKRRSVRRRKRDD